MCNRMFFNADWRVFEFDGKDGEGKWKLKEWEETEHRGGGMGRSDVGVFGVSEEDFPPEQEDIVEEVGEVSEEVPKK